MTSVTEPLNAKEYAIIVKALSKYVESETLRLGADNASETEWQQLSDVDAVLIKCMFREIMEKDNVRL